MRRVEIYEEGTPTLVIAADAKGWPWMHMKPGQYFTYHWRDHQKVVKGAHQASSQYGHKFFAVKWLGRVYCRRGQEE